MDIDWQAGRVGGIDFERTNELCQEFGFRRLAEQISQLGCQETLAAPQGTYRTVRTPDELLELAEQMSQQTRISLDIRTTSTSARWAEIVGCSFAWREGQACYVPVRAPVGEMQLDPSGTLAALRPILENPAIEKVGQNLKFSLVVLRSVDIALAGIRCDTMVADYLLDPGQRNHDLEDLARRHLKRTTTKLEDLIGTGKKQKRLAELPLPLVAEFVAERADVCLPLGRDFGEKISRSKG